MRREHAREKTKRWLLLLVGLLFVEFGVGLIIRADVGVFPTTCFPFVISNVAGITMGKAVIIFQSALILGQLLILRKKYKIVMLLQIPVGICVGYIMDFALFFLGSLSHLEYPMRWVLFLAGNLISAIGMSIEVIAGVATLPTEGFVIAVCEVLSIRFGPMKIVFDLFLVFVSLIGSLLFLHRVIGIREDTLLSAIFLGYFSKHFINVFQKCYDKETIKRKNDKKEI